jgi:hypothetical protein
LSKAGPIDADIVADGNVIDVDLTDALSGCCIAKLMRLSPAWPKPCSRNA